MARTNEDHSHQRCASPGCEYLCHSSGTLGRYCCFRCSQGPGRHGVICEHRLAAVGTSQLPQGSAPSGVHRFGASPQDRPPVYQTPHRDTVLYAVLCDDEKSDPFTSARSLMLEALGVQGSLSASEATRSEEGAFSLLSTWSGDMASALSAFHGAVPSYESLFVVMTATKGHLLGLQGIGIGLNQEQRTRAACLALVLAAFWKTRGDTNHWQPSPALHQFVCSTRARFCQNSGPTDPTNSATINRSCSVLDAGAPQTCEVEGESEQSSDRRECWDHALRWSNRDSWPHPWADDRGWGDAVGESRYPTSWNSSQERDVRWWREGRAQDSERGSNGSWGCNDSWDEPITTRCRDDSRDDSREHSAAWHGEGATRDMTNNDDDADDDDDWGHNWPGRLCHVSWQADTDLSSEPAAAWHSQRAGPLDSGEGTHQQNSEPPWRQRARELRQQPMRSRSPSPWICPQPDSDIQELSNTPESGGDASSLPTRARLLQPSPKMLPRDRAGAPGGAPQVRVPKQPSCPPPPLIEIEDDIDDEVVALFKPLQDKDDDLDDDNGHLHGSPVTVPVDLINFTQKRISPFFRNGNSIMDTVTKLNTGDLDPLAAEWMTCRVWSAEGVLHSVDNRRLWCLKQHQMALRAQPGQEALTVFMKINVRGAFASWEELRLFLRHYDTENGGRSVRVGRRWR
mmetsp:Transcript_37601/g.99310  ORF Transcript_37601/g.99310 Transcript_37601/m.99310 type:complete len:683 (+) Transcript_37601:2-2050(+)